MGTNQSRITDGTMLPVDKWKVRMATFAIGVEYQGLL